MDVSRNGGDVAFRTAFSDEYDLVQVMCGLSSIPEKNCPVDFRLAALQRKGCGDIWHMDQVLAFSTDECSPMVIHGEDIGGNHGHPCAIRVTAPGHGKTVRDVGTLWHDEGGMGFTLLRVEHADKLLFLSENVGASKLDYAFADHITGALTCTDTGEKLCPKAQQGGVQLTPAIRHVRREAVCLKDGVWRPIDYVEGCDCAEIREEYEIINPATVARAIRDERPEGGYTVQPTLAAGEAMFIHRMTYRVENDGAILCSFDHECLQDVPMPYYLGIMHQLKCDVYGGGVRRYMPKVRPFEAKGIRVDFTRLHPTTAETMPDYVPLTPDLWTNPTSPPERQIDFICRPDGTPAVGFASGFLPVDDGEPARRAANITDAGTLVKSCKTYPTFAGGLASVRHPKEPHPTFPRLKGTAYKKYFLPEAAGACCYTVPHAGDTYVYMDFFSDEPHQLTYTKVPGKVALLLEADVSCRMDDTALTAQGTAGFAAFCVTAPAKKG
ncbi:MAG: hypothetical protein E7318_02735 [Clostridiales bacterium]|nr:hypothetical protein [Clostridiales bacterium]